MDERNIQGEIAVVTDSLVNDKADIQSEEVTSICSHWKLSKRGLIIAVPYPSLLPKSFAPIRVPASQAKSIKKFCERSFAALWFTM